MILPTINQNLQTHFLDHWLINSHLLFHRKRRATPAPGTLWHGSRINDRAYTRYSLPPHSLEVWCRTVCKPRQSRHILGSNFLYTTSDYCRIIDIKHLVLNGSSQWEIGKNVTNNANILNFSDNDIQFYTGDVCYHIYMFSHNFLSNV